jgi:type IV secretion system protein VirB9
MIPTPKQIAASLALTLLSSVAFAAEMPKPCGPEDSRQRCIAYRPGQVVTLVLTPGKTMMIELPEGETVYYLAVSDNDIIKGDGATQRVAVGGTTTVDPNLETSVPGEEGQPSQFVSIKAKRELEPQPFSLVGEWTHPVTGKKVLRNHIFEIHTTTTGAAQVGTVGAPAVENEGFFSLVFSDPVARREVRKAQTEKLREEQEVRAVSDRLQQVQISTLRRNIAYDGQATEADRVAIAPSAPPGLDAMWDDGQRTFLRYPGNRGTPVAYQVLADGTEATIGQNVVVDPATKGSLLIIHKVVPMLRLRDGASVVCITNNAYDPTGTNSGTGTVDPGIVRDVKGP